MISLQLLHVMPGTQKLTFQNCWSRSSYFVQAGVLPVI